MKRYCNTLFRYWFVALIPLIVVSAAEFVVVKKLPTTFIASAMVQVNQPLDSLASDGSAYLSDAQNGQADFVQWLQSTSFDLAIAEGSPRYARALAKAANPRAVVYQDFVTAGHVQITATGPTLLNVTYTGTDWQEAMEVENSLLKAELNKVQALNQQRATAGIQYYTVQLRSAQTEEQQSAQLLSNYVMAHQIPPSQVLDLSATDPTLATLYQQNQSDRQAVLAAQNQLLSYQAQGGALGTAGTERYVVVDSPVISVASNRKQEIMDIAIALVLGLLLGGFFVVGKTALDPTLWFADEVPALLDLPLLAAVPYRTMLATTPITVAQPTVTALPANPLDHQRKTG